MVTSLFITFLSLFQEKELRMKDKYEKIKGRSQQLITDWEDKSREAIMGFIEMFGQNSMMVCLFVVSNSIQEHFM